MAWELRTVFPPLNGWGKQFVTHENDMRFQLQCPQSLMGTQPRPLLPVRGGLLAVEPNNGSKTRMGHRASGIYYITLHRKYLPTSMLRELMEFPYLLIAW